MKKLLLLSAIVGLSISAMAQGKSQKTEKAHTAKAKNEQRNVNQKADKRNNGDVYQNQNNTTAKYAKNTPSNVSESFKRDYPNASNVTWTKNQGYWVAIFSDGLYRTSVRYSANGERTNTTRRRVRS